MSRGVFTQGKWKIHAELMKEWRLQHALASAVCLPLLMISQTDMLEKKKKTHTHTIKATPLDHVFASVTESVCCFSPPCCTTWGGVRGQ